MPNPKGITPFADFVDSVADYRPRLRLANRAPSVAGSAERAKMRDHVLWLYEGAEAVHSFADSSGNIFDCYPVERQPGTLRTGDDVPKALDMPDAVEPRTDAKQGQLTEGAHDEYGNAMFSPPGTVPLLRLTLDRLFQHATLGDALSGHRSGPAPDVSGEKDRRLRSFVGADGYRHAHAQMRQSVTNRGGHGCFSVNRPTLLASSNLGFSLSQLWIIAGGIGTSNAQTVETGWAVEPDQVKHTHPNLFVFHTADGYRSSGDPSHTGDAQFTGKFVQTNNRWTLGGALEPASIIDAAQRTLVFAAYLSGSRWWVYVGGTTAADALGYYPTSVYQGAGLSGAIVNGATVFDVGGETANRESDGVIRTHPMGSGAQANAGWGKTAYVRDVRYYPSGGGSAHFVPSSVGQDAGVGFTASSATYAAPWNRTLWYGGPGTGDL